MSFALKIGIQAGSPTERLARVLKENKGRYNISKDGFISINMDNADVQDAIKRQVSKLVDIKERS
ncbi:multidrug ABC transporter ATPase [Martelella alba]|uniref:Multidrug ABC transporter ATPase n=2 Tax=Martelella alba TaxID=2590451 RepID=A0ABY2SFC2_9HYPH|nr:multidrug ABC transporter ATPase [Martelella alba]